MSVVKTDLLPLGPCHLTFRSVCLGVCLCVFLCTRGVIVVKLKFDHLTERPISHLHQSSHRGATQLAASGVTEFQDGVWSTSLIGRRPLLLWAPSLSVCPVGGASSPVPPPTTLVGGKVLGRSVREPRSLDQRLPWGRLNPLAFLPSAYGGDDLEKKR